MTKKKIRIERARRMNRKFWIVVSVGTLILLILMLVDLHYLDLHYFEPR